MKAKILSALQTLLLRNDKDTKPRRRENLGKKALLEGLDKPSFPTRQQSESLATGMTPGTDGDNAVVRGPGGLSLKAR